MTPDPAWFLPVALGAGGIVGLALGLTGGGGSIFAVPLLIYVLGLPPERAVPVSLVAVALTAAVGAAQSIRRHLVVWQPTLMFAAGGMAGAPLGFLLARGLPDRWLVGGFGLLALVVGVLMGRAARQNPAQATAVRARDYEPDGGPVCVLATDGQFRFAAPCAAVLAVTGFGTGLLSGIFGIGGGFLIVPGLVFVTRMGVHRAVATSLVVITVIGTSGAASALAHGSLDSRVLVPFAAGGAVAMLAGRKLAGQLAGPRLQTLFATLISLVGIAMLADAGT